MSSDGCMGSLGLKCIFKVDEWTHTCIAMKVLCRFLDLCTVIEESSCGESVPWESEGIGK
jgi:hypothetical protein